VVFGVILASGAGAGIAIDQVAHHGPNNSAGDWGHSPLPYPTENEIPGDECYCGKRGCLETWVSGYSFVRDYEKGGGSRGLAPADIAKRMRQGEVLAIEAWDRYVDRVGQLPRLRLGACALRYLLGPDLSSHLPSRSHGRTNSPIPTSPDTHACRSSTRPQEFHFQSGTEVDCGPSHPRSCWVHDAPPGQ
jgi:hypothetical protein